MPVYQPTILNLKGVCERHTASHTGQMIQSQTSVFNNQNINKNNKRRPTWRGATHQTLSQPI